MSAGTHKLGEVALEIYKVEVFADLSQTTLRKRREMRDVLAILKAHKPGGSWHPQIPSPFGVLLMHEGKTFRALDRAGVIAALKDLGIAAELTPSEPTAASTLLPERPKWQRVGSGNRRLHQQQSNYPDK